jgi:preprotein translocase subunit SecA
MFGRIFAKIFGSRNQRVLRRMRKVVERINALEEEISAIPDAEFPSRTVALKERLKGGE